LKKQSIDGGKALNLMAREDASSSLDQKYKKTKSQPMLTQHGFH